MNIFRPQKPYVFHPPKYSPVLAPIFSKLSEHFYLRKKFAIRDIHLDGEKQLEPLVTAGHSLLLAPNHADHADPHALVYAGKSGGTRFHFMAAREGFEKSGWNAFVLQRMGAFSVDREGADVAAIKTAMQIIQQGRFPLVIFPEGEIWHHHEQLDELNEGVATIVLRAAAKLEAGRRCYLVPTGLRYSYDESIRDSFSDRMNVMEDRIAWKPRPELPILDRIYRFGGGLLALKEEEYLGQAMTGTLRERIDHLQTELVGMVEARHGRLEGSVRIPERVKWLRAKLRKELVEKEVDEETHRLLYDDLDTLFLAVQLYSYPGTYLSEQPTTDRIAETVFKLEEDVLGEGRHAAPRQASVRFGEPLDVAEFLDSRQLTPKTGVAPLTQWLREHIQKLVANPIEPEA